MRALQARQPRHRRSVRMTAPASTLSEGCRQGHRRGLITERKSGATVRTRTAATGLRVAGFSTAAAVTNVSGRGVGMDVVRTNVGTHRRQGRA